MKHPRQRNTSKLNRVVWDDNVQIKLIPRLSEDEKLTRRKDLHEIETKNHDTEEEDDYGSAFVNDDEEGDTEEEYCDIFGVVDVIEEDTVVVKKKEKKKTHSTRLRRSLRLQTSNLGSGFTDTGRRFSRRLKALK